MLAIQKNLTNGFYAILSLPSTAMGFALTVQIAALSWILRTKYELDIHDIGLVWAAGPIAGILGQVIIGKISDNVWFWGGRRRPFILIGGVFASLSLLALPNIDVISSGLGIDGIVGVAITIALVLDLSINISFNPTRTIIADVTPEGTQRTKGYTWMQFVSGSFGMTSYLIGAIWDNYSLIYFGAGLVLLQSVIPVFFIEEPKELAPSSEYSDREDAGFSFMDGISMIKPLWGFALYGLYALVARLTHFEPGHYWVEGICIVITLIFVGHTLLSTEDDSEPSHTDHLGFQKVLAAHAFTWLGVQSMFVYMFSYLEFNLPGLNDNELGTVINISFFILNLVGALLPVLLLQPLSERYGRVKTHAYAILSMSVGYFILAQVGNSAVAIYVVMAVVGIGWSATISLPFAIMSQKVEQSKMGMYMGIFNLSVVFPQLVCSLGIGRVISNADNKNLLYLICAASLLMSALCWFTVREDKASEGEEADSPIPVGH